MENRAHYALIGTFVLVVLAAAVMFTIWLTDAQFDQEYDIYEIAFEGGVQGLSQGSEVRFSGLPVGAVTDLRYDQENPNLVLARVQITEGTPVDSGSLARLTPLGLTGLNYIEIDPGGPNYPMLNSLPGRGTKRIEGEGSAIDGLLSGGGNVIESAQEALARFNLVLSDEAREDFQGILANIEEITGNIDASEFDMQRLNNMMDSFAAAADEIAVTARGINGTSDTINDVVATDLRELLSRAEASLGTIDATVTSFGDTSGDAQELIVDARDAVNRLSNSGLTDMEETVDAIRRLVLTLGRVADSLEQSPTQFIVGAEREEVVLPQ